MVGSSISFGLSNMVNWQLRKPKHTGIWLGRKEVLDGLCVELESIKRN
jgi:hypothetical protein